MACVVALPPCVWIDVNLRWGGTENGSASEQKTEKGSVKQSNPTKMSWGGRRTRIIKPKEGGTRWRIFDRRLAQLLAHTQVVVQRLSWQLAISVLLQTSLCGDRREGGKERGRRKENKGTGRRKGKKKIGSPMCGRRTPPSLIFFLLFSLKRKRLRAYVCV